MTNASIPLQVNSVDTATPIQQMGQSQNQNAMATEQLLQQHYQTMDTREKSRLSSVVSAAVQLKPFLDNNDLDGAHNFLMQRKDALHQRMGSGENIDTEDTDHAIELLRQGKVDELKQGITGLMAAGQVYGLLKRDDQPSNVQEWQYYNSLDPAAKEQYLTMKRANTTVNLGGSQVVPSQVNPSGAPQASFPVTPKPEEMPAFKQQQAEATAIGTKTGDQTAAVTKNIQDMQTNMAAFEALKTSSASAPSGAFENVGATLANKSGAGGTAANAQGDFTVKRANAENAIRATFRVAGSGAQSDADAKPFIDMLPDASDAADVKATKVDAAMHGMMDSARAKAVQRGLPDPFPNGNGVAPVGGGNKINIVNPQTGEAFQIDPADLQAAQAEGFQQQ